MAPIQHALQQDSQIQEPILTANIVIIFIITLMSLDDQELGESESPAQCRNGPVSQRHCTDFICVVIYLILVGSAVLSGLFFSGNSSLTAQQINQQLATSEMGSPLVAIGKAIIPILLSLGVVAALCLLLSITTFLIPAVVAYIYIPLCLTLMVGMAGVFLWRSFGKQVPMISQEVQQSFAQSVIFGFGITFLLAFGCAIITIACKKSKFKYIVPVLQLSRAFFWPNCYVFFVSCLFSTLSITAIAGNILLLDYSQASASTSIFSGISVCLIATETLWTHGLMEALSDFFFESVAIHWYFRERRLKYQEEGCCGSLCLTLWKMFQHAGTIIFGHILAYIPETLNTMIGKCRQRCGCCYNSLCVLHRFTYHQLTKYCYIQTILQSLPFCSANRSMFTLKRRTKTILPAIYMMGNLYVIIVKIFVVMIGLTCCYFLTEALENKLFGNLVDMIGPMIVTGLASLQITNHFMNMSGLVGDTLAFMYSVDLEIEKRDFGELLPNSCPQSLLEIIDKVKGGESAAPI